MGTPKGDGGNTEQMPPSQMLGILKVSETRQESCCEIISESWVHWKESCLYWRLLSVSLGISWRILDLIKMDVMPPLGIEYTEQGQTRVLNYDLCIWSKYTELGQTRVLNYVLLYTWPWRNGNAKIWQQNKTKQNTTWNICGVCILSFTNVSEIGRKSCL